MATLPNVDRAIIDERKLTGYLLNRAHRFGGGKAAFFERFGFTAGDWKTLRDALIAHARDNEVGNSDTRRHGQIYEITGPLATPDGRNPTVLVAWMIRHGETEPRLVTAVPA
jgi:filamentous hemagglutinin